MPRYATEYDLTTDAAISDWKITAKEEIEDIGSWRDADSERRADVYWTGHAMIPHGDPPRMPNNLYTQTAYLCGAITSRYPKLDPQPIQDVYSAISAWYADCNADRIPPQPVLFATLEEAMLVLNAIESDIQFRMIRDEAPAQIGQPIEPMFSAIRGLSGQHVAPEAGTQKDGKHDAKSEQNDVRGVWLARAMLLVRDNPHLSDAEIARRVGKNKSTLTRSREYKAAASLARGKKDELAKGYTTANSDTGQTDVEAFDDADDAPRSDRARGRSGNRF